MDLTEIIHLKHSIQNQKCTTKKKMPVMISGLDNVWKNTVLEEQK